MSREADARAEVQRRAALADARRIGPGGRGPMLSSWVDSTGPLLHALEQLRNEVNRAMDRVQVGGRASSDDLIEAFCEVRTLDCLARQQREDRDAAVTSETPGSYPGDPTPPPPLESQ